LKTINFRELRIPTRSHLGQSLKEWCNSQGGEIDTAASKLKLQKEEKCGKRTYQRPDPPAVYVAKSPEPSPNVWFPLFFKGRRKTKVERFPNGFERLQNAKP
jgi:hypothetical protein